MNDPLKFQYVYISVIIFLISDLLILFFPELKAFYISWIIKGSVVLYYSHVFFKESDKLQKIIFSALCCFFLISQSIFYYLEKLDTFHFINNTRFFVWYMFLLIISSLFFKTLKRNLLGLFLRLMFLKLMGPLDGDIKEL